MAAAGVRASERDRAMETDGEGERGPSARVLVARSMYRRRTIYRGPADKARELRPLHPCRGGPARKLFVLAKLVYEVRINQPVLFRRICMYVIYTYTCINNT